MATNFDYKVRNPEMKELLVEMGGVINALEDEVADLETGVEAVAVSGAPVAPVAAAATLTLTGSTPIHGETVTVGDDVYQAAADEALTVDAGNIVVDITSYTTASSGTLTMDTNPTATNTLTIGTAVYTFVEVPAVKGDVVIGDAVADTQATLVSVINDGDALNDAHPLVTAGDFSGGNESIITAKIGGTAGDDIDTTETFTAGTNVFAAANLGSGADCTAANFITALVLASAEGTEAVAVTDGAGDTAVVTASVKGVAAESIVVDTDIATASFGVAHLDGGADGTVGLDGQLRYAADKIYISVGASTTAASNWKYASLS